jgi:malonyl CoA-acyl carrier protein transacylase/phosphopantetheinyl transferase (holo-ACP synthase)
VLLGHSSGESAALGASGANPATTPAERQACISKHFAVYEKLLADGQIPVGALLAVGALPTDAVEATVASVPEVVVAMDNCANQMVLYGPPERIVEVQGRLTVQGGICLPLPFDRGYHTPAFAAAAEAFLGYYKDVKVGRPKIPMYSCASAGLFPDTPAAVRKLAAAQWASKVRFRETVLKMHDDGVRLFVEVGPSSKLTAFVNDVLIDRECSALSTNVRRKNGVEQLLSVLGQLHVVGRGPVLERLFAGRRIAAIDLAADAAPPRGVVLDNTLPMIRLSDADRAALAALAVPAPVVVAPAPAEPVADLAPEPAADDGRAQVMADYFDVMRGFLDQQRSLVEALPATAGVPAQAAGPMVVPPALPAAPSSHARPGFTPLLDTIVEQGPSHVLARCRVSLLNDAFIRDHVMSGPVSETDPTLFGLSCVPFTVSLEVMAEACALLAGRADVKVIENVRTFDWVALDDGELSFDVRADVIDRAAGRYAARVITARGPVLTAEFLFEAEWRLGPVAPLPERRESCLNAPYLYSTGMFHGPVFQSMEYVEAWDHGGIDVALSEVSLDGFFEPGHRPQLVLNPVLLDAMGQLVACWLVQYVGTEFHAFPSTIQRLELYEPCPADRPGVVMQMRQRPLDPSATDIAAPRVWQFDCIDGDGNVLMRGDQLVNLFFRVPQAYHEVRTDPLQGLLGAPLADTGDTLIWDVPLMSEEFLAQSGAICLRIMAHALLGAVERDEWRLLQGPLRRKREWLFGRGAIKEAVRTWVHARTGQWLYPSDITVGHDELGAPFVWGWWSENLCAAPRVSLSHNSNYCVVGVSERLIGVDLEEPGRLKQPELLTGALAPSEQGLVQGLHGPGLEERQLRLWCAKEAAAKCLGLGLQGRPWDWQVTAADEGFGHMTVTHAQGTIQVEVLAEGSRLIALAKPAEYEFEG